LEGCQWHIWTKNWTYSIDKINEIITYTVTGIDANGCIGTGTGTVTVVNPPSPPSTISHN
jgi:hypothetical protein